MSIEMLDIIYEDDYILAVHKPAGMATQTSKVYEKDVVSIVTTYLASKSSGKPKVPGLINRLDQPVEGIVLFGLNTKTTANLSKMLTEGKIEKHYYAAFSELDKSNWSTQELVAHGRLEDYLLKKGKTNTSSVVDSNTAGAKKSILEYQVISSLEGSEGVKLADIHLITGRHHQIRVQMSNAGMPLLGDSKYAPQDIQDLSKVFGIGQVALCAYSLSFIHPVNSQKVSLLIEPKGNWFDLFSA